MLCMNTISYSCSPKQIICEISDDIDEKKKSVYLMLKSGWVHTTDFHPLMRINGHE